MKNTIMPTYGRLPVSFSRGQGVWLWDREGNEYLDAISGIGVCSLGHAHEKIADVICEQSRELLHTSNLYGIDNQQALADKLCTISGMDNVFFSNSGAEANEAAIKLARIYGHQKGIKTPTVIVMENSFHGRTLATLSATGNRKVHAGFEPLVQGFCRVPFNDIEAIKTVAQNNQQVVAILVEPIQGEGGINIPDANYLNELRQICDDNEWLLMLDEIQSGMCRTGKWFAFQHSAIKPDVLTLAKALGNGIPIGACLAHGKAANLFQPGNHGSTFGGNPFACRVAAEVIDIMARENIADHAVTAGNRLKERLEQSLRDITCLKEIRNKGLMIGIELTLPCGELVAAGLSQGVLINVTRDKTIRLLPPLIINDDEIEQLVTKLTNIIKNFDNAIEQ